MINDLIHGETWLASEAKDIDAISEIEYRNLWRVYEAIKDHRNAFCDTAGAEKARMYFETKVTYPTNITGFMLRLDYIVSVFFCSKMEVHSTQISSHIKC